jgi:hypothetical protein
MTYRARIYLQRLGDDGACWCGVKRIKELPARQTKVSFEHKGKIERGHIELIAPDLWEREGRIPTILVVQESDSNH